MLSQSPAITSWKWRRRSSATLPTPTTRNLSVVCSCPSQRPVRYAVLGAGFAGLSVAWNLLRHSSKESHISVDIYDEAGVAGGASGVAGGLLHPYTPKVKLQWHGVECWKESLNLLNIAEVAFVSASDQGKCVRSSSIIKKRGILRPLVNMKNKDTTIQNAQKYLPSCRIETINEDAARELVPNLSVPSNIAFYMPEALNINAQIYLQGLFLACESLANNGSMYREFSLHKKPVHSLSELSGDYNAVIICIGARTAFLPELHDKLPLRTCRGIIAQMQLDDSSREGYPERSPSILSDAWLAVNGTHHMDLGSTWDWNSKNYCRNASDDEATKAMEVLLPKASSVYPDIKIWNFVRAVGGLRAMPPVQEDGSLPLLGCVNELVHGNGSCKYWLFTGLGARGLFFHGWLGKLLAQAVLAQDESLLPSELTSWKRKPQ